jgi:5-formyltetrahydrofolate cyclo-ligase
MSDLPARKAAARVAAAERRAAAAAQGAGAARIVAGRVLAEIGGVKGLGTVAGYHPMRSELDPMPALLALAGLGRRIALPVVEGRGAPLRFRLWAPGEPTEAGPMGTQVPAGGDWVEPDLILAPLLAFDAGCYRLGYGGGFYDRTLADLRARRPVRVIGLAYAAQEMAEVPRGPDDQRLDAVATEAGILRPA